MRQLLHYVAIIVLLLFFQVGALETRLEIKADDFQISLLMNLELNLKSVGRLLDNFMNENMASGKIVYFRDDESFRQMLIENVNYNRVWLICVDSDEKLDKIADYAEKPSNFKFYDNNNSQIVVKFHGLIINDNLVNSKRDGIGSVPFAYINQNDFNILVNQSIEHEVENTFAFLIFSYSGLEQQKLAAGLILISFLVLILGLNFYIRYKLKRNNTEASNNLYSFILCLSLFSSVIAFFMAYYVFNYGTNKDQPSASYTAATIYFAMTLFRSLFWFMLFAGSYGWEIYISQFTPREVKFLVFSFIIIYISFSIQYLVSIMNSTYLFGFFNVSDLKNFLVFICLLSCSTYYNLRGLKLMKVRY